MTFGVLFVCSGNVCRSPVAERLMRARIPHGTPIEISSAGTRALVGYPVDGPSAQALRELGGDPDGHAGRMLTADLIGAADLVLTADIAQRSIAIHAQPATFRRIFTMREFARLGAGLGPLPQPPTEATLRERTAVVAGQRGQDGPPDPGTDDIGDPFGANLQVARNSAAQVAAAVDGILHGLGLVARAEPEPTGQS